MLVGTFNLCRWFVCSSTTFSAPIPLCPILYATLVCAGKTVIYHPSSGEKVLCFCFENFPRPPPSIYLTGRNIKQARGHEVLSAAKLNRLSRRSLPCWHQQRKLRCCMFCACCGCGHLIRGSILQPHFVSL